MGASIEDTPWRPIYGPPGTGVSPSHSPPGAVCHPNGLPHWTRGRGSERERRRHCRRRRRRRRHDPAPAPTCRRRRRRGGGFRPPAPLPSPPPPGPRRFAVAVANHYHMAAWQSFFSESAGVLLRRELGHASSQPHRAHPGRKNLLMTVAASIRGKNLGCASQPHSSPSRSAHHWHSASGVPLSNSRTAPRPPSGDSTSSRRCPQSRPGTPPPPLFGKRIFGTNR